MCGNGGRCVIDFARVLDIIHNEVTFMAVDGVHKGRVLDQGIALKMQDVHVIQKMDKGLFLDTGSPHYVLMVDELNTLDVVKEGRLIRNSANFIKKGVNVNFVLDGPELELRTYERGVEDETLSCGTGAVATAIAMHYNKHTQENIVFLNSKGGVLNVSFDEFSGVYKNIWLSGEANMVYAGDFEC